MKKLIYRSLFLALVGIGIVGCKKEVVQNTGGSSSTIHTKKDNPIRNKSVASLYSVENGLLKFNSSDDFEQLLQLPNEDIISSLINLGYTSYEESLNSEDDNLIQDEFLSAALNKDQAIQIGGYIFRINKASETVFALPINQFEMYNDLISENTTNQFVLSFSTEEDVFDLLDSNDELKSKKNDRKCSKSNDDGDGSKKYAQFKDEANLYGFRDREYKFHYKAQVRYDGWGIYKKLFTEFKHWETLWGTWDKTHFTINYTYNYVTKTGATGSASYLSPIVFDSLLAHTETTIFVGGNTYPIYDFYDKKKEIIHYRSIRCLNKFYLSSTIWFRNRQTRNPNKVYSRTVTISEIL